jgi:CBS domain-containing protein
MPTSLPGDTRVIVRDVMTPDPIMLRGTATVREAGQAMRRSDVGDVLVMRDDAIFGIVTDRDIVVRNVAEGRDPNRALLDEICSRSLVQVSPDDSIDHAIALMRERAIRRIPVVVGDTPVGIVSLGDLAAARDPESALAEISVAPGNL